MAIHNVGFQLVLDETDPDVPSSNVTIGDANSFMGIANIGNGRILAVQLDGSVWRSSDNGKSGTWTRIASL